MEKVTRNEEGIKKRWESLANDRNFYQVFLDYGEYRVYAE